MRSLVFTWEVQPVSGRGRLPETRGRRDITGECLTDRLAGGEAWDIRREGWPLAPAAAEGFAANDELTRAIMTNNVVPWKGTFTATTEGAEPQGLGRWHDGLLDVLEDAHVGRERRVPSAPFMSKISADPHGL